MGYGAGANQIFLDSQMMIEARWPNTTLDVSHPIVAETGGGSYVPGGTSLSTGTIISPGLPSRPAGYWNGANINICLGACWTWQTGTVTDSPAGNKQLSFTFLEQQTTQGDVLIPTPNNAFYLWGKLGELDSPGEWFLDSSSSTLYFWPPATDNPAQHAVEAKRRQFAFD